jgi:hypothetical protein
LCGRRPLLAVRLDARPKCTTCCAGGLINGQALSSLVLVSGMLFVNLHAVSDIGLIGMLT